MVRVAGALPRVLALLLALGAGVVVGVGVERFLLGDREAPGPSSSAGAPERFQVRDRHFHYTSPLLECETVADAYENRELRPFRGRLEEVVNRALTDKRAGRVAVYFRDLNNGPWFGINWDELFIPASLLKVPVMMAVLQRARREPGVLDREVVYRPGPEDLNEVQGIRPRSPLEPGRTYRVHELLRALIAASDNNARLPLESVVTEQEVSAVFDDLGIVLEPGPGDGRQISVKRYATLFRILYNAGYLTPELSEYALSLLADAEYARGLSAGLPRGVQVAHKFGEFRLGPAQSWRSQLHDCGIVYFPGRPYLLCVMTRGDDAGRLADVIAEVSRVVFEEVASQQISRRR